MTVARKPRQPLRSAVLERRWAWFFISPWVIGLLLFFVGPLTYSFVLSFTNYNVVENTGRFVGLTNWLLVFTDPTVQKSLVVTLRFALIAVPLLIFAPLMLALFLNSRYLWARGLFLTLFFLPQLLPPVVVALIWQGTLNSRGPINQFLQSIGLPGPQWLTDPLAVIPAMAIIGLWSIGGSVLQLLAAMKNVPGELYEAARIDGANSVVSFFRITIPLASSVLFFAVLTQIIAAFQYFTIPFVLYQGQGGPDDAGLFYMLMLYKEAFVYFNTGRASGLAWILFIICFSLTQVLFLTARRWVYYAGEVRQ
ncbi:carbohydrate ABC transporter permease [Deinococcus sp.]|uniref:carbohydrate ABC transporter permease n=1 Tax=Deinococcus sp. TaxID=47478 RepID=UPI003C79A58A